MFEENNLYNKDQQFSCIHTINTSIHSDTDLVPLKKSQIISKRLTFTTAQPQLSVIPYNCRPKKILYKIHRCCNNEGTSVTPLVDVQPFHPFQRNAKLLRKRTDVHSNSVLTITMNLQENLKNVLRHVYLHLS